MDSYGMELILDLHECSTENFTRIGLLSFFDKLCERIDMEKQAVHFWDYQDDPEGYEEAPPHLKGTSAVQFIKTSNIVVHTLDDLKRVYINIFSCKSFDGRNARMFCEDFFEGKTINYTEIPRT